MTAEERRGRKREREERRREERAELRRLFLVAPGDAVLELPEAAAFMGVSESWLAKSDVPRAPVAGLKFLRSQCLAYVRARLTHTIPAITTDDRAAS